MFLAVFFFSDFFFPSIIIRLEHRHRNLLLDRLRLKQTRSYVIIIVIIYLFVHLCTPGPVRRSPAFVYRLLATDFTADARSVLRAISRAAPAAPAEGLLPAGSGRR